MNLVEALKSGRDIGRPDRKFFGCKYMNSIHPPIDLLTREDLVADDWEVEPLPEQKVTITRQEFFKAVADTMKETGLEMYGPNALRRPYPSDILEFQDWKKLADKLGFK